MKKNRLILALFCTLFLLTSCIKTKYEFYPSGKLKSETHYRFGKETGTTTYYHSWYPTKIMEIQMKRGKRNGIFIKRYFDNNVEVVAYYKNDLLEGRETHYFKNGKPSMEVFYTKGIKNGDITTWYSSDVVRETGAFVNDLFDGEWEYFDERGLIIGEGTFSEGTGLRTSYDEMGNLQYETNYVNNLKDGLETHFLPSGDVEKTLLFKEDRIIEINGFPVED
jgi:antitoxin component YwqK of YwqJK toxin-antitoxin module